MPKPLIFISHIGPEKEIAIAFQELVENSFLGMVEVFVSSDDSSIKMGQPWLDAIKNALKTCCIEIILCSHESVKRPWINFEAGAGWIRDITVIPLCHSGMRPSKLPIPLNLLQAASANEISSLKLIFPVIAQAIGSTVPQTDFTPFVDKVTNFETRYTHWNVVNETFTKLTTISADILPNVRKAVPFALQLTETQIGKIEETIPTLKQKDILGFQRHGSSRITPSGVFYQCSFTPLAKLADTLANPNFQP